MYFLQANHGLIGGVGHCKKGTSFIRLRRINTCSGDRSLVPSLGKRQVSQVPRVIKQTVLGSGSVPGGGRGYNLLSDGRRTTFMVDAPVSMEALYPRIIH